MSGARTSKPALPARVRRPGIGPVLTAILALLVLALAAAPAGAATRTWQAERLREAGPGLRVYKDRSASARRAMELRSRGSVTIGPSRFRADRITIRARGKTCAGNARMLVTIGHRKILASPVLPSYWREYGATFHAPKGRQRLRIRLSNPGGTRSCRRLLNVDWVQLTQGAVERSTHTWRLAFDDEFNGTELDTTKWNPTNWKDSKFYDPANVLVADGRLLLRASAPNRSAMVQTLGKFEFTYGRLETEIKVPRGKGFWPAVWTRTPDLEQPYGDPEIDLLEMWMTNSDQDLNDEYTISHNYHYENQAGVPQSSHTWTRSNTSYATGFHTLGIEWEPGRISWFVDGIETKRFTGPLVASTPQFLVFSLQIGHASWIGPAFDPDQTTPFPSYMQVNWVRVWQRH